MSVEMFSIRSLTRIKKLHGTSDPAAANKNFTRRESYHDRAATDPKSKTYALQAHHRENEPRGERRKDQTNDGQIQKSDHRRIIHVIEKAANVDEI